MSHPHDDTVPVEHDPSGMRALLASLPEPGPMPADLVARISAALQVEAQRGDGIDQLFEATAPVSAGAAPDDAEADAGGRVVPLHRRSRLRYLGVAAAAVVVMGVGGYVVGSDLPGDVAASFGAAGGSADSGVAEDSAAGSKAESAPRVAPDAGSGEVVVVMSGVDHASTRLDATAGALDDGTLDPVTALTAESPALGPIATPVGARSCADALGIPADAGLLVDVSEVDGASAAVLVVHSDEGRTAYAVDRSCTTGNTGLIRGPVALD